MKSSWLASIEYKLVFLLEGVFVKVYTVRESLVNLTVGNLMCYIFILYQSTLFLPASISLVSIYLLDGCRGTLKANSCFCWETASKRVLFVVVWCLICRILHISNCHQCTCNCSIYLMLMIVSAGKQTACPLMIFARKMQSCWRGLIGIHWSSTPLVRRLNS